MRVPGLAWWPGTIPANAVQMEVVSTMDIYPTALEMAGVQLADDRIYDGRNLLPMLKGEREEAVRDTYFYYRGATLFAARKGPWKAHFITQWAYTSDNEYMEHDPPLLYHMDHDPSEKYNLAEEHPEVIEEIRAAVAAHQEALVARPDQLVARIEEE